jgi:hypothetical protein
MSLDDIDLPWVCAIDALSIGLLRVIVAVGASDHLVVLGGYNFTCNLLLLLARSSRLLSCKLSPCKLLVNYLHASFL